MKRIVGVSLILMGTILGLFVEGPMLRHLSDDPRSASPDYHRGLVIRDNCHGTVCYITKANADRAFWLKVLGPLTVLSIAAGIVLARTKSTD